MDSIKTKKLVKKKKVTIIEPLPYGESFVHQKMLTCIGNKRKLVSEIEIIVDKVRKEISKNKLSIFDGFSGSNVVSRMLSYKSNELYVNDLEHYVYVMSQCQFNRPSDENKLTIRNHIDKMNILASNGPYHEGFISKLYAPLCTNNVLDGERCFYTRENALIIDTLRKYIEDNVEDELTYYCLAPLLIKASIHTNTAGVFKGFYKSDGIGCWGGKGANALSRIKKQILLEMPIWNMETDYTANIYQKNINELIDELEDDSLDLMYLDPPYNQHPYGSNYFMLNLIAKNEEPTDISKVSGIPTDWNKSSYNKYKTALDDMTHLLETGLKKSKYILLSYNNEGILREEDWIKIFKDYSVEKHEILYDTFKGSRNLKNRSNKVIEIMYLIHS